MEGPGSPAGAPGTFRRDNSNLLRAALQHGIKSDASMSKNPRTSMSQLKLSELSQANNENDPLELERFGLEELRNGFFEPIYLKPAHHVGEEDEQDAPPERHSLGVKAALREYLAGVNRHREQVAKFAGAYFLAVVLCLVHRSGNWFGKYRFFLPISVIINHPVHSIGTQLEITVFSIAGLFVSVGWSALALYVSTATSPTRNHQGGIIAGSLFIGIFVMSWFQNYFLRLYHLFLTSGLVLIFISTNLDLDSRQAIWKNTWNIAIPYLFGLLVSLFFSVTVFPDVGHSKLMGSVLSTIGNIRSTVALLSRSSAENSDAEIVSQQKSLVYASLKLSEDFREFLSEVKICVFDQQDLKDLRNHLNFTVGPLRAIPTPTNIHFSEQDAEEEGRTVLSTPHGEPSSALDSGSITPMARHGVPAPHGLPSHLSMSNRLIYIDEMNRSFSAPLRRLLLSMAENLDRVESCLRLHGTLGLWARDSDAKAEAVSALEQSQARLKRRVSQLDTSYRRFTKSEFFLKDLLQEEAVINMFLFLRYSRQASINLVGLTEVVLRCCANARSWRVLGINYPFKRGIRRLPRQVLRDQNSESEFHYFETKVDVNDAFERIYNLNTSRFSHKKHNVEYIGAIDHNDFTHHSSTNKLRFRLWSFLQVFNKQTCKLPLKLLLVIIPLALPAWLQQSWAWYFRYNCFWAPFIAFYILSPKSSYSFGNLLAIVAWLLAASFWGWAGNQARHFSSPIVIGAFSMIIGIPLVAQFLTQRNPRASLVGLIAFSIVGLDNYAKRDEIANAGTVFKVSWIDFLALLVGIVSAVLTNWLIWPFNAKVEIFQSCSSLLSHIGQSYQSVAERYLYRDKNDDPTELTLELANIREVRMQQSLFAIRELLEMARNEYDLRESFKYKSFKRLLNSCDLILEKMIEARISGIYFNIWEQDNEEKMNQILLSLRRDSVSTVIYILFILSNSFKIGTGAGLPIYLPDAISVRKRLYDLIGELEVKMQEKSFSKELNMKLSKLEEKPQSESQLSSALTANSHLNSNFEKSHWTEIHGMSFARAFTAITEELETLVKISRDILGEDDI